MESVLMSVMSIGKLKLMLQENKMNKKNRIFLTWVIGAMLATIGFPIWFEYISPSSEEVIISMINNYKVKSYDGVIVEKFIDEDNRNLRKIVLQNDHKRDVQIFGFEVRKTFDFLMIGDTIKKKEGSLFISLSRYQLDTIIELQFIDAAGDHYDLSGVRKQINKR
ncbi:hypothetical protein EYV94_22965 [Puteibacter caeruleilacunae]|nr:hypothetical protein EYV94_22965 [Puteibacter caeruleilacunae]